MQKIESIAAALIHDAHQRGRGITVGRMERLIYLSDWRHAIQTGRPISTLNWRATLRGPSISPPGYSWRGRVGFGVETIKDRYEDQQLICILSPTPELLGESEADAVNHVIEVTADHDFPALVVLTRSTLPFLLAGPDQDLDFAAAADFRARNANQAPL